MVCVFARYYVSQQTFAGNALVNSHGRKLADGDIALTAFAGIFRPDVSFDIKTGRHEFEFFRYFFANPVFLIITDGAYFFLFLRFDFNGLSSKLRRQGLSAVVISISSGFDLLRLWLFLLLYLCFYFIIKIFKPRRNYVTGASRKG